MNDEVKLLKKKKKKRRREGRISSVKIGKKRKFQERNISKRKKKK